MKFSKIQLYATLAFQQRTITRALIIAFFVGITVNIIHQGGHIATLEFYRINVTKFLLTFLVPYLVSSYTTVSSKLNFEPGEVAGIDAVLQCKVCKTQQITVHKGEIIPFCHNCTNQGSWKVIAEASPAEEHLVDKYRSMALFAELNPSPVFRIDKNGTILKANASANTLLNRAESTLEGENLTEFFPGFKRIDLSSALKEHKIIQHTETYNHSALLFELRGIPESGTIQAYGADITELETNKTKANTFELAVEQTSNTIMITDTAGNIEYVNQAFEDITGYTKDMVYGKNPRILKTDYLSDDVYKDLWQKISNGERWKGLFHNRKRDGSTYWEEATITPVKDEHNNIINYMAIKEDVTEQIAYKERLQSMSQFATLNPAPVFRMDEQGVILESNPQANKVFHYDDIKGMNINELLPDMTQLDIKDLTVNDKHVSITWPSDEKIYHFSILGVSSINACHAYGTDITEQKQAEEAYRSMALFAEKNPAPVFRIDQEGQVTQSNPEADHVFPFDSLTSNHISEIAPEIEDLDIPDFINNNRFTSLEKAVGDKVFHFTLRGIQDLGVCQVYGSDITALKQAEEAYRSMALFAEKNPAPVFRIDQEGQVTRSNPEADNVFPFDSLTGTHISEIAPEIEDLDIPDFIHNNRFTALEKAVGDKVFYFSLRGIQDIGVCQVYGSDITALKQAEAKIVKQSEQIRNSINYAQRIQQAILPDTNLMNTILPEHFVFLRPRDVVSGDFYWINQQGDKTIVVAADCTGHGVPGGFMSMLGVSFLNEIVHQDTVNSAGEILTQLREYVKNTLYQSDTQKTVSDGMDLSLIILEPNNKIQFAGAYNPLYIIRNKELIEIPADKMPIGKHIKEKPYFTNHTETLEAGDMLYIFSDGYPDQLGGDKEQKFSKKALKEKFIELSDYPADQQKEQLIQSLDQWKGDFPQIDDILVMGLRIS